MNDLFKELRFMGLRQGDDTRVTYVEAGLKSEYNFTDFLKISTGEYIITNLYDQGCAEESLNYPIIYRDWRERRQAILSGGKTVQLHYNIDDQKECSVHLYTGNNFTKKPKGLLLSAMKSWIQEKERCFESLSDMYNKTLEEHKVIHLIPISFRIHAGQQDKLISIDDINKKIDALTTAFKNLITTIKSRSIYDIFLNYSRVILLDKLNQPYLHAILYCTQSDISDSLIRDLTRTWCEACDSFLQEKSDVDVSLNYVIFKKPFPPMNNDEPDDDADWQEGIYYRDDEKIYRFNITVSRIFNPFSQSGGIKIIPIRLKGRKGAEIIASLEKLPCNFEEVDGYSNAKEFERFVKNVKQDKKYHLYFLEQVAKQYIKIPGLNNITHGQFGYSQKKKKEKE